MSRLQSAAVLLLFLLLSAATVHAGTQHMYGPNDGPETWAALFPNDCAGKKQSPINVHLSETVPAPSGAFTLWGGHTPITALAYTAHGTLKETFAEHNIHINTTSSPFQYHLLDVHWHMPAEHTINGIRYPIERHMVFYPMDQPELDGHPKRFRYLVFSTMFEEGGSTEDIFLPEAEYQTIGYNASNDVNAAPLSHPFVAQPKDLSDDIKNAFWTYEGGWTTPNCTEIVDWHISQVVRHVSPDVLASVKAFQLKMATPGTPTSMLNARPVQRLNGRVVTSRTFAVHTLNPNTPRPPVSVIHIYHVDDGTAVNLMAVLIVVLLLIIAALGYHLHMTHHEAEVQMQKRLKNQNANTTTAAVEGSKEGRKFDSMNSSIELIDIPPPTGEDLPSAAASANPQAVESTSAATGATATGTRAGDVPAPPEAPLLKQPVGDAA